MQNFSFELCNKIFEEQTRPLINNYLKDDYQARTLLYTINPGKNRFRSGLAYLLSGQTDLGIAIGAASEVAWAAILILDDIGDNTFIRRGIPSAWQRFGLLEASHAAALGFIISKHILQERVSNCFAQSLEKSIEFTLRAQIEQKNFSCSVKPKAVLANYINKTALGRWPIEAAVMANKIMNEQKQKKIVRFSETVAIGAQIRNDLDDLIINSERESYEPAMKDLQDTTMNYPLSLFFELASVFDKTEFLSKYWGQSAVRKKQVAQDACNMLIQYDIFNKCGAKIGEQLDHALNLIADISFLQKDLIIDWAINYKKKR